MPHTADAGSYKVVGHGAITRLLLLDRYFFLLEDNAALPIGATLDAR
jgi:hypothetical protein